MSIQTLDHLNNIIRRSFILLTMVLALLSGCGTTVPLAASDKDAEAKRFEPPADKAYIYVMREYRYTGWPHAIEVMLNDKDVASLRNENYALFTVTPGKYTVAVSWDVGKELNYDLKSRSVIELNAENGKMYFLKTYWVFAGQLGFSEMNKNEGKQEIMKLSRVKEKSY